MKIIVALLVSALAIAALASCTHKNIGAITKGSVYPDAGKYTVGTLTYSSEDIRRVEVNWISGSVEIKQGEGELCVSEVNDKLSEDEQMHWMISDGVLYVQFCKSGHFFNSIAKKELSLEIPRGVEIDIGTTSADVFADGLEVKKAHIGSVSGDVRFGAFSGEELDVGTTSGDLTVDSLECEKLDFGTVSGDAEIGGMSADRAQFGSTSGKVKLALTKPAEIRIKTVSGDTRLSLGDIGAKIELSGVSADLVTKLGYTKNGKEYTIGGGEAEVKVSSTSGDVYVE
ncbi:MAG: DUF4097 family beta strand repeat-containing protein [Eubacteriales bacterium]